MDGIKHCLMDMDGVILRGTALIPGVLPLNMVDNSASRCELISGWFY